MAIIAPASIARCDEVTQQLTLCRPAAQCVRAFAGCSDLALHLAHLPFRDGAVRTCADEGIECRACQVHPQALRLDRQDGEVFEHKGSHRSLSLSFSQKLLCLRAANVLATAYEFETERRCFS
jgi:hypothetical protein